MYSLILIFFHAVNKIRNHHLRFPNIKAVHISRYVRFMPSFLQLKWTGSNSLTSVSCLKTRDISYWSHFSNRLTRSLVVASYRADIANYSSVQQHRRVSTVVRSPEFLGGGKPSSRVSPDHWWRLIFRSLSPNSTLIVFQSIFLVMFLWILFLGVCQMSTRSPMALYLLWQ